MIGTILEAHHDLCLVREPEWITISVPCSECVDGQVEYETRSRNFFDPFGVEVGPCGTCHGEGYVLVEVCRSCLQETCTCEEAA